MSELGKRRLGYTTKDDRALSVLFERIFIRRNILIRLVDDERPVGGVAHWLGCRSLAGRLYLPCDRSMFER